MARVSPPDWWVKLSSMKFADLMSGRIADALEQQKIAVAGTMFGEPEDDAEDLDDDDIEWDEDDTDEDDVEEDED